MIIGVSGRIGSGKDTVGMIAQALTMEHSGRFREDPLLYLSTYQGQPNLKGGWPIKKYAYKLKQIVSLLTGIPVQELEKEGVKASYLPDYWDRYLMYRDYRVVCETAPFSHIARSPMTVRELLQEVGTDAMRKVIHPNVWVNALLADYKVNYETCNLCGGVGEVQQTDIDFDDCRRCNGEGKLEKYPNWIITDVRFPNEAKSIKDRSGIVIRVNRGDKKPSENLHESETALDDYKFDYVIENNGTLEELVSRVKEVLKVNNIIN